MIIRLAAALDLDALVEFNQAMALETEGKRLDPETLSLGVGAVFGDDSKGFYVVADDDGQVAAGLMVTFEWSDWRNSWFWWIQSVYVLPRYRGMGTYGRMYEYVKDLATAKGNVCGFRLYVENSNGTARGVYEKLGMRESHYRMYEE